MRNQRADHDGRRRDCHHAEREARDLRKHQERPVIFMRGRSRLQQIRIQERVAQCYAQREREEEEEEEEEGEGEEEKYDNR